MDDDDIADERSMLEDLQLAAELGKTLLERNKELETSLRHYQNLIEDQTQEIEYLTKQTAALREVNDSRLRIYEQLEVSIQDLERANQRLSLDNAADKKHIKSLCLTIDSLETKCEELQRTIDDLKVQQSTQRRLEQQDQSSDVTSEDKSSSEISIDSSVSVQTSEVPSNQETEMVSLLEQLRESRTLRAKEQRKVGDLEEQLAAVIKENLSLEEQLAALRQKEEDMKSLQEEISTLEEVRQGQLCARCLRNVGGQDELSLVLDPEEEEDASVVNSIISETHRSTVMLQIEDSSKSEEPPYNNPYRVLVEKYEALLEMQRNPASRQHQTSATAASTPPSNCLSLQEELQLSGDFSSFNGKPNEDESDHEIVEAPPTVVTTTAAPSNTVQGKKKAEKAFSATPTDFSEAETSSSGFAEETASKATQTTEFVVGSFLCSIADGDDCRFSIYDDASPVESRFRKTPEYRQLFREIFAVLKRAAEAKDEGEALPLLEDHIHTPRVPPVTPAKEDLPEIPSTTSSDAPAVTVEVLSDAKPANDAEAKPESANNTGEAKQEPEKPTAATPAPKRDILEYLSIGVGVKKKSGKKNSPAKLKPSVAERVEQIESNPNSRSPSGGGRRKRGFDRVRTNWYTQSPPSSRGDSPTPSELLVGRQSYARQVQQQPQQQQQQQQQQPAYQTRPAQSTWDFQPFASSASQEVAKLKRLEKSYAEVLRLGPQKPTTRVTANGHHHHYRK